MLDPRVDLADVLTTRRLRYGRQPMLLGRRSTKRPVPARHRRRHYGLHQEAVVLHCPGDLDNVGHPFSAEWFETCDRFFADPRMPGRSRSSVDDLTVITYNTNVEPCLLERCAQRLGFEDLVVLGAGVHEFGWEHKIILLLDHLRSGACTTKYVLCLDGFDVLLLDDFGVVLDRYLETYRPNGADIVFCPTVVDWPASEECRTFEQSVSSVTDHQHLNSGALIGRTDVVLECLEEIDAARTAGDDWCVAAHGFDDQLAWRQLHRRRYPQIRIDDRCRMFVRFDDHR